MEHVFKGKWISNKTFANLRARNVFHRQLEKLYLDCSQYRNQHILFRKTFRIDQAFSSAKIYISADDYYKLYINGRFVAQGPSPSYHFQYNYNEIDISTFLAVGENFISVHTLYQGLINRVWQSGDFRHGMICDVVIDGKTVVFSDESFKVKAHSAYSEMSVSGKNKQTQFLEEYDSRSEDVGFQDVGFKDCDWNFATRCRFDDHTLVAQKSYMLEFEYIRPEQIRKIDNRIVYDFGSNYVGYLVVKAKGHRDDVVVVRCAQELNEDGAIRFNLRADCVYEEKWILSGEEDLLDWFDYKAFRYAELEFPESVEILDIATIRSH